MTKILFICHGNICRSPMAEFVMKDLAAKAGESGAFEIASAAVSREELGNPVYPPAKRKLLEHGIRCDGHAARQMTRANYDKFDYIIGMDTANIRNLNRMLKNDPDGKVYKFLSFTGSGRDIADPWYTGDFTTTYSDIVRGCEGFLTFLEQEGKL